MRPGPVRTGPLATGSFRTGPGRYGFGRPGPIGVGWGHFHNCPFGYFRPFCYPYYPYYSSAFLGPFSYVGFPADYQSNQEPSNYAPQQDNSLADQVGALTDEVEQLRAGQASGGYTPPPAAAPPAPQALEEKTVSTVFAYRDGHQFEAQNYAVVGQTLWVFGDGTTRKIALADLDLGVTKKLNDQRGVELTLPEIR